MFLLRNNTISMKSYFIAFLISISAALLPLKPFVTTIILFVVADTILGIYTTIKLKGIRSFSSTKLFNLPVKVFFYSGSILLSYFVDKHIFEGAILGITLLLTKACTMLWIYIEVKSMDETSMKLGNKSFWVLLKEFVNKVKAFKKDINDIKG
jgi:hypothetical protein